MKRTLTWKGIEFIEDEHWIWTWYLDWKRMLREQIDELTIEQVCEATTPKTDEEREEYYEEKDALDKMEERMCK